jgi:hypothetical protein
VCVCVCETLHGLLVWKENRNYKCLRIKCSGKKNSLRRLKLVSSVWCYITMSFVSYLEWWNLRGCDVLAVNYVFLWSAWSPCTLSHTDTACLLKLSVPTMNPLWHWRMRAKRRRNALCTALTDSVLLSCRMQNDLCCGVAILPVTEARDCLCAGRGIWR